MHTSKVERLPRFLMVFGLWGLVLAATPARAQVPTDPEIRAILAERVEKYRQSVGIVVGIIEPQGRRVIAYGKPGPSDARPLDGNTVFEIGSATKVFTSLLLANMVERGEVTLLDPVAKHLPEQVRVPERKGVQITLKDLAMHTSGLPLTPWNVDPGDPSNPFADYSVDRLYEFLESYRLPRDIGSHFQYSNIGGALLGHALGRRAGMSYEELVEARITRPLGMPSTRIAVTPDMKARLATGHAYGLEPTPGWDFGALAAASALHSTANDLLTFLSAHLGYTETPLAAAMASMIKVRRDIDDGQVGLSWLIDKQDGVEIVSHDGSTGGYRAFMGYDPKARVGVVVLSNSGTGAGVADIGLHLLNSRIPLKDGKVLAPAPKRTEITIDPKLLDAYVGLYRFPSNQLASVTRDGSRLFLQGDGDVKVVFYAESNQSFFAKLMDAQMTFVTDRQGYVIEMLFRRNGSPLQVKRID